MYIYTQQGQNDSYYDYCKEMTEQISLISQRESSLSTNEVNMIMGFLGNRQLVIRTQINDLLRRLDQKLAPEDPLRININKILGSEV